MKQLPRIIPGIRAGLRPIRDASRAIAMFSFSAAEVTNQDIGRMHVHSLSAPEPGAEPSPRSRHGGPTPR